MKKIAIIGSGISGLTIAKKLSKHAKVTIFEKSIGVGGRLATRRKDGFHFDHGAQFFTAKSKEFKNFISLLDENNIINRWDARFAEIDKNQIIRSDSWCEKYPHYVGSPSMNNIGKYLSRGLDIKFNTKVTKLLRGSKFWNISDDNGNIFQNFDWVICAIPPKQLIEIVPKEFKHFNDIENIKMQACYSLMLGYEKEIKLSFDAALIHGANISWISVDSSKPLRPKKFAMVINSTNKWADNNIDVNDNEVKNFLLNETSKVIKMDLADPKTIDLQRWRYANISKQKFLNQFIDYDLKIGVCGDWCIHGRVESAFLSGFRTVNEIRKYI